MQKPFARSLAVAAAVLPGSAFVAACLAYGRSEPARSHPARKQGAAHPLPSLIRQCEQSAEYHCGTWTLVDAVEGVYRGEWDQGRRADLQVRSFDRDGIEVYRVDREGPSVGVTGLYRGRLRGRSSAEGTVTWYGYAMIRGTWAAKW